MSIEEIPNNPFLSGYPIYPCNLVGRKNEAEIILRYLPRVIKQGIPEHFFITGKRGVGKTSFIQYVASIAEKDYNMIPVYVNNKGSDTIDELIGNLVDALFKEIDKTINSKRFEGFASSFHKTDEIVTKNNFKEFLVEICDDLEDNGIFFIIDDVNGLSENPKFANWYKGLFETLRFYNEYALVVFSIATSPSNFDELCKQNPSFCRMFNLINLSMI